MNDGGCYVESGEVAPAEGNDCDLRFMKAIRNTGITEQHMSRMMEVLDEKRCRALLSPQFLVPVPLFTLPSSPN